MQFFEHQDYDKHKTAIDELLVSGYPIKKTNTDNTVDHPLNLVEGRYFDELHEKYIHLLGVQKGRLQAKGFLKSDSKVSGRLKLVTQCQCGAFYLIKPKSFEVLSPTGGTSCDNCEVKMYSFGQAFFEKHGYHLSKAIIDSIVFGIDFDNQPFVQEVDPYATKYENNKFNGLTDDDLKGLLKPNSIFEKDVFFFYVDGCFLNPRTSNLINRKVATHELPKMVTPNKEMAKKLVDSIGEKIFRLTILGFSADSKSLKAQEVGLVCQCDCGAYKIVAYRDVREGKFPVCEKCSIINSEIMGRFKRKGEILSVRQAWEYLGEDTSVIDAQIKNIKTDASNAYAVPPSVKEQSKTPEKYQSVLNKRYGLVMVKGVSKRPRNQGEDRQIVCECDCGMQCVFPFKYFEAQINPYFLACSSCELKINRALDKQVVNNRESYFNREWRNFLTYFRLSRKIPFVAIYHEFLKFEKIDEGFVFAKEVKALAENYKPSSLLNTEF